jgi:prepilin-type processing-associated H-X9-DG protein
MVAVGVMMVMAALVLPAVNSSRSVSHRLACQHNMRELGQLLVMFSQDNNSYYPAIGPDDNAGSFTMQLTGANFVDRSALEQMVTCPGGLAAAASRDASTLPAFIPSVQQMQTATPVQLAQWRHQMSGHMAYRIGFVNNGRYYPVRNSKHCQLAVLADTPTMTPEGFHSTNHDGGQNVLWQDGSVSFEPCTLVSCTKDHIYLNNEGLPSAGLGWCDSVLAPSHATPGVARDTQPAPSFLRIRFNFVPARQLPVILDNSMLSAE